MRQVVAHFTEEETEAKPEDAQGQSEPLTEVELNPVIALYCPLVSSRLM